MRLPSRRTRACLLFGLALLTAGGEAYARQPQGARAERAIPVASQLPVGAREVLSFAEGSGVDRQSTVLLPKHGGFVLVYARFEQGDMDTARLLTVASHRGDGVSAPRPLAFGNRIEDAPAFITTTEGEWLYFGSSDDPKDLAHLRLWRARVVDGEFEPPQRLADVAGLDKLDQWPRWVDAGDDVLMTFRGPGSVPTWLRLRNGVTPSAPVAMTSEGVAYPRVVPMPDHGCFVSYQRPPEGGYMATWYRVSPECSQWSAAHELSPPKAPNKPDVHDAYALARRDGGVDVYYVYPSYKGKDARFPVGFDLYRRSITADGTAGPEQLLTQRTQFNPFAPSAHRLADGTILVTFSDIQEHGELGVKRATLALFKLREDAPSLQKVAAAGGKRP